MNIEFQTTEGMFAVQEVAERQGKGQGFKLDYKLIIYY